MRSMAAFLAIAAWLAAVPCAQAGVYGDDLTKCFIESTGSDGQSLFVQWVFGSIAQNPSVHAMAAVSDDQKKALDQKIAVLWQKMLFEDCHDKTVAAIRYEGPQVLEAAFSALGQAAFRGLLSDPQTVAALTSYFNYVDKDKLAALMKEAGVQSPLPSSPPK